MFYFNSLAAFFHMGGYATYVWTAYSIVLALLFYQLIAASRGLHRMKKKLRKKNAG